MDRLIECVENEDGVLGFSIKKCEMLTCKDVCKKHFTDACRVECPIKEAIDKLAIYEDLEEQGKLLKLPCAVGDSVWFIKSNFAYMKNPKAEKIRKVEIIDGEIIFRTENRCFEMKYIDKTVFLTREEAEAALKELME